MKKNISFEEQTAELEDIVRMLDEGEAPLEELVEAYEKGMTLANKLNDYLEKTEQKIIEISKKQSSKDIFEENDQLF